MALVWGLFIKNELLCIRKQIDSVFPLPKYNNSFGHFIADMSNWQPAGRMWPHGLSDAARSYLIRPQNY